MITKWNKLFMFSHSPIGINIENKNHGPQDESQGA